MRGCNRNFREMAAYLTKLDKFWIWWFSVLCVCLWMTILRVSSLNEFRQILDEILNLGYSYTTQATNRHFAFFRPFSRMIFSSWCYRLVVSSTRVSCMRSDVTSLFARSEVNRKQQTLWVTYLFRSWLWSSTTEPGTAARKSWTLKTAGFDAEQLNRGLAYIASQQLRRHEDAGGGGGDCGFERLWRCLQPWPSLVLKPWIGRPIHIRPNPSHRSISDIVCDSRLWATDTLLARIQVMTSFPLRKQWGHLTVGAWQKEEKKQCFTRCSNDPVSQRGVQ